MTIETRTYLSTEIDPLIDPLRGGEDIEGNEEVYYVGIPTINALRKAGHSIRKMSLSKHLDDYGIGSAILRVYVSDYAYIGYTFVYGDGESVVFADASDLDDGLHLTKFDFLVGPDLEGYYSSDLSKKALSDWLREVFKGDGNWIRFTRASFASNEDWECLCEMSNCDPNETKSVKIFIANLEIENEE